MLERIDEVEQLLEGWRSTLGDNYPAYRNHIYRVINLCTLQRDFSDTELRQLIIAACFHDIAIWLDDTFDYLSPSCQYAHYYLQQQGLTEWYETIAEMIEQHHKITRYRENDLVELFRRADWIDVSRGAIKFGLTSDTIRHVLHHFPNAGFHRFLLHRSLREFLARPWRPLPMMRW